VAFSADGARILTGSDDRSVCVCDAEAQRKIFELPHPEDCVQSLQLSPEGRYAGGLSSWQTGRIYLWDLHTGKDQQRIPLAPAKLTQLAFSPDGRMLAAGDTEGAVTVYEVSTGRPRFVLAGHHGEVTALAFSADGLRLVSGGADTRINVWEVVELNNPTRMALGRQPLWLLQNLWRDLASEDAGVAFRAMRSLASCPESSESLLRTALEVGAHLTGRDVDALIAQLDHPCYAHRTLAMSRLADAGPAAKARLLAASRGTLSAEAQQRIQSLLNDLEAGKLSVEQLRCARALETLDWIGTNNSVPKMHARNPNE
jgi:hypothetical protein